MIVRRNVYLKIRHALPWHLAECNLCGHLLTKLWARVVVREARDVGDPAGVPDDKRGPADRVGAFVQLNALGVAVYICLVYITVA